MGTLESAAVLAGAMACFFYGFYGITLIGTSDCTNATLTLGGQTFGLSVLRATSFCMLAFAAGVALVYFEQWMGTWRLPTQATFGGTFGATSQEGSYYRGMTWRFALSLLFFLAIFAWMQFTVVKPLTENCAVVPVQGGAGTMAWSARQVLEKIQTPMLVIVVGLYVLGILFSAWQMHSFETHNLKAMGVSDTSGHFFRTLFGTGGAAHGVGGSHRFSAADAQHAAHLHAQVGELVQKHLQGHGLVAAAQPAATVAAHAQAATPPSPASATPSYAGAHPTVAMPQRVRLG